MVSHLTPLRVHCKELITILLLGEAPPGLCSLLEGAPAIPSLALDHFPSRLTQDDWREVL